MNAQGEGIVDELIRYLDSHNGSIYVMFGESERRSMTPGKIVPVVTSMLVGAMKFRLPMNGQIYRKEEDYLRNTRGLFNLYAFDYELDMLHYPPYDSFTLEYEIEPTGDMLSDPTIPKKVVILCSVARVGANKAEAKQAAPLGLAFKVFEYRDNPAHIIRAYTEEEKSAGVPTVVTAGWSTNTTAVLLDTERQPSPHDPNKCCVELTMSPDKWENRQAIKTVLGSMWVEVGAILQFMVAINARHGITRAEVKSKPRKQMTIRGRRLGYTYHVLDIDPEYIVPAPREGESGHHASPRFHLRRAHVRHLSTGKVTFVRQCTVGSPVQGVIEKDYRVTSKPKLLTVDELGEIHALMNQEKKS